MDGACFGRPDGSEIVEPETPVDKMPKFLKLTPEGMLVTALCVTMLMTRKETHQKYDELMRLEEQRLIESDGQWARLDPDPVLDRYSNIHPWANNRIKLQVPDGVNDYINASPVTLSSTSTIQSSLKKGISDKYICMQGPKFETVDHTWHMIWHELAVPYNSSAGVVIMLSPTHAPMPGDPSKMFEKCYRYFPHSADAPPLLINKTNQLGDGFKATVRFESKLPDLPGTTIEGRKLIMTVDGEDEEKPIYHYLYPSWPDFGALEEYNVESIIQLMHLSREKNGKAENPRVVHCSAGVGRTGTFVALEFLMGELQGGSWENWDEESQKTNRGSDPVYETVNQLRMQRRTMVQAFEQYAFLYEVLRKMWEEKYGVPCIGGEHQHRAKNMDGTTSFCEKRSVCGRDKSDSE